MTEPNVHPAFLRARALRSAPWHHHFPKNHAEAQSWRPAQRIRALSGRVLAVAQTRIECKWAAYCDAVPGMRHEDEWQAVLEYGAKLDEAVARALFPTLDEVPYAD